MDDRTFGEFVKDLYQFFGEIHKIFHGDSLTEIHRIEMYTELFQFLKKIHTHTVENDLVMDNLRRVYECALCMLDKNYVFPKVVIQYTQPVLTFTEEDQESHESQGYHMQIASIVRTPTSSTTIAQRVVTNENVDICPSTPIAQVTNVLHTSPTARPSPIRASNRDNLALLASSNAVANEILEISRPLNMVPVPAPLEPTSAEPTTGPTTGSTAEPTPSSLSFKKEDMVFISKKGMLWPTLLPKFKLSNINLRGPKQTSLFILDHVSWFTPEEVAVAQKVVNGEIKTSNGGGGWPEKIPHLYKKDEQGNRVCMKLHEVFEEIRKDSTGEYSEEVHRIAHELSLKKNKRLREIGDDDQDDEIPPPPPLPLPESADE